MTPEPSCPARALSRCLELPCPFLPSQSRLDPTGTRIVRNHFRTFIDETKKCSPALLIKHEKLDLRICLWPSQSLLLHEETIPDRIAELKDSFLHDGVVKDPIIVDADSSVVLDGMHRVAALRELRCLCIPVCAVDYLNPSIRVGVWYRAFSGPVSPAELEATLASSGIKVASFSADMTSIEENLSPAIIFASGECYRLDSEGLRAYEVLKVAEHCARDLHLAVAFETERDAVDRLMNRKADAIMTLPRIDKATVREAGLTGRLLPHKVTRHVIPARPLRVNTPLGTLIDDTMPLHETNQKFVAGLQARGIVRNPSGAVIEGRRYEEETFIFN